MYGIFDLFCGQFLPYKGLKKVENKKMIKTKKVFKTVLHIIPKIEMNCFKGSKVIRCRSKIAFFGVYFAL